MNHSPMNGGAAGRQPVRSLASRALIAPIRFYQRHISPALPPTCRYYPTCSAYAVEALQEHGAAKGTWLAVRRLLRCHPWHAGGFDPVPERGTGRRAARERGAELGSSSIDHPSAGRRTSAPADSHTTIGSTAA